MACKMVTFWNASAKGNVRQVTNLDTGITVNMPGYQMFQDIRFHVATDSGSHSGGTLQQAYDAEGYPFFPYGAWLDKDGNYVTDQNSVVCIKNIYQMSEYDPINKMYVDRKPGEWIYDEACRCVSKAQPDGRVNIGDGFVIPSTQEQISINALMGQSAFTFIQAMQKTCPDIIPPADALPCIEKWLKGSSLRWYDIYRSCRADWIVLQTVITPPVTTPPVTLPVTSNKNIFLIAGAILLIFAFGRK